MIHDPLRVRSAALALSNTTTMPKGAHTTVSRNLLLCGFFTVSNTVMAKHILNEIY